RRGPHMGEIEVRANVAAEIAQVLVRPGRPDLAIEAGLGMLAVPAHPEAVAIGGGGRFERPLALHHQPMGGGCGGLLQRGGFGANMGGPGQLRGGRPTRGRAMRQRDGADSLFYLIWPWPPRIAMAGLRRPWLTGPAERLAGRVQARPRRERTATIRRRLNSDT